MARQQKLSDELKTLSMLVGHEECSDTAAWLELFHVNALNSEDENGEPVSAHRTSASSSVSSASTTHPPVQGRIRRDFAPGKFLQLSGSNRARRLFHDRPSGGLLLRHPEGICQQSERGVLFCCES